MQEIIPPSLLPHTLLPHITHPVPQRLTRASTPSVGKAPLASTMTSTKSCMLAVVIAAAMQGQADGFVCSTGGVASGRKAMSMSSLTQGSSAPSIKTSRWATSSSKLNLSQYEEYMANRNSKEAGQPVAPEAEKEVGLFESYMKSREKVAAMPPAEKEKSLFEEYTMKRATVSVPGASPAASPAPPAAAAAAPAEAAPPLSQYEQYMASRDKVKAVEAKTTYEDKAKSSVYEDYMKSRTEKEGVSPADCAEEECDFEEKTQQAGLFHSYMSSRGIKMEAEPAVPEKAPEPVAEMSFYDSYMASRSKVTEAYSAVKPEEVAVVSEFESFSAARAEKDAAMASMPPAEKEAAMFDDYKSDTSPGHIGSGGMADTRDPAPVKHADPRKSISAAPSFEEYLKSRG